jgi:hypothetical protein
MDVEIARAEYEMSRIWQRLFHKLAQVSTARWMVLAALALAIGCFLWGERVPVRAGFGWDGATYARWAQDFHGEISVKGVDDYYIKRILPSAIIHYSLRALSIPRTDYNVLRAFGLLDVALIVTIACLWGRIARQLALSDRGQWLGFVALFVNYIILKHTFYCPVTTDIAGLTLGAGMLWCYLGGHRIALCAIMVAGAFTWPMTIHVGALLFIFPRAPVVDRCAAPVRPRWNLLLAALTAAVTFAGIRLVLKKAPEHAAILIDPIFVTPIRSVLNLSIGIALAYVFLGIACLFDCDRLFAIRSMLTWQRVRSVLVVLTLVLAIAQVQTYCATTHSNWGLKQLLPQTAYATVAKPGVFLVTHVAYYGPMFLLAMFLWRPICRLLHQHGLGLTLAVAAGLVLSLNSQSRYVLTVWILLVPFIVKATEPLGWGLRQYGLIAGLAVLGSKVWMTMNTGPFRGNLLEFPDQYMFMSHGPWISTDMYFVQGIAFLAAAGFIYAVCFWKAAAHSDETNLYIRRAA